MKSSLWLFALALLLHGCATPPPGEGVPARDVTIFTLPFGVQTYVPVTLDTIEDKATCRFALSRDDGLAVSLREAVAAAGPGEFDNAVVRLKATGLLETEAFIDQEGGLLLGSGLREAAPRQSLPDRHIWHGTPLSGALILAPGGSHQVPGCNHLVDY